MLCKVLDDYNENINGQSIIRVWYWRQPDGDINKAFVPGFRKNGKKTQQWRDNIERNSVLVHNPTFTNSSNGSKKVLTAATKKMIPELNHPQLQGWVYKNNLHYISSDNRVENVKEGEFVLVNTKDLPAAVNNKVDSRCKDCPIVLGRVFAKSKQLYGGAGSVSIGVQWYFSRTGDPNAEFVVLLESAKRQEITLSTIEFLTFHYRNSGKGIPVTSSQFPTSKVIPVKCEFAEEGGSDSYILSNQTKVALCESSSGLRLQDWVCEDFETGSVKLVQKSRESDVCYVRPARRLRNKGEMQTLRERCKQQGIVVKKDDTKDMLKAYLNSVNNASSSSEEDDENLYLSE